MLKNLRPIIKVLKIDKQGITFLFAGVLFKRGLPLPIPNREVKALTSDDTSPLEGQGK